MSLDVTLRLGQGRCDMEKGNCNKMKQAEDGSAPMNEQPEVTVSGLLGVHRKGDETLKLLLLSLHRRLAQNKEYQSVVGSHSNY